jgi:hypothetical protein
VLKENGVERYTLWLTMIADTSKNGFLLKTVIFETDFVVATVQRLFGRVNRVVAQPGSSQIRTCGTPASGSSKVSFAQ